MSKRYWAMTRWIVTDVMDVKPEWTKEQAREFLDKHETEIESAMIEAGWMEMCYLAHEDYDDYLRAVERVKKKWHDEGVYPNWLI